jgi:hypothetical protein
MGILIFIAIALAILLAIGFGIFWKVVLILAIIGVWIFIIKWIIEKIGGGG